MLNESLFEGLLCFDHHTSAGESLTKSTPWRGHDLLDVLLLFTQCYQGQRFASFQIYRFLYILLEPLWLNIFTLAPHVINYVL